MKNRIVFFFALFILFISPLFSQNGTGNYVSNIKWKQIENQYCRIVYPQNLYAKACRIASLIEQQAKNHNKTIGPKYKKVSIILGNQQVYSNGYVGIAPYQSAFYGVGFQNQNTLGSIDWLDGLALHEYRHVLQFSNAKVGITAFSYWLMGEYGWAGLSHLALPNWYFEGDAVLTETLLSDSGRGRLPAFLAPLYANLKAGKRYSYMVARNGSYTKNVVNHYPMGFVICNHVRNEYSPNVFKKAVNDAMWFNGLTYPFSKSLRRQTGKSSQQLYKESYDSLWAHHKRRIQDIPRFHYRVLSDTFAIEKTRYYSPQLVDEKVYAIKKTPNHLSEIVELHSQGNENHICYYGVSPQKFFSVSSKKMAWVETKQNPFYKRNSTTEIVVYDLVTKKKSRLCKRMRLFSPQLSHDGMRIVAVQVTQKLDYELVIINVNNGQIEHKLIFPEYDFISYPQWSHNDETIVFIAKNASRLNIIKRNLLTDEQIELLPWTNHSIGRLTLTQNRCYYPASYSGLDNMYSVDLSGRQEIHKITHSTFGVYEPFIDVNSNQLLMQQVSWKGSEIISMPLYECVDFKKQHCNTHRSFTYKEPKDMSQFAIHNSENDHSILSVPLKAYQEKAYSSVFRGLRPYAWTIVKDNVRTGAELLFTNPLNEWGGKVSLFYQAYGSDYGLSGTLNYGRWPIKIGVEGLANYTEINKDTYYVDNAYRGVLAFPMQWNHSNYWYSLNTRLTCGYRFGNSDFADYSVSASWSTLRRKALKNIYPRWGYRLSGIYEGSLKNGIASRRYFDCTAYVPGLFTNHGTKLSYAYQKQIHDNEFVYINTFRFARGYKAYLWDQVNRFSIDYSLPVFYPDWGFENLIYFKRIRLNLFYDYMNESFDSRITHSQSAGVEFYFDNHYLNILPISFGIRRNYKVGGSGRVLNSKWNLLLEMNL